MLADGSGASGGRGDKDQGKVEVLNVVRAGEDPNPDPSANQVTADTSAHAATVPVALFGQPSVPIERSDLAEWCGGAADDLAADEWSWMGS